MDIKDDNAVNMGSSLVTNVSIWLEYFDILGEAMGMQGRDIWQISSVQICCEKFSALKK